jgi:hypothetical protein
MTLAIRGGRASLRLQLGPRTWLLAVTRGFGRINGLASEAALLQRLQTECDRHGRYARFRRSMDRPQAAATAIQAILTRVNFDLFTATASHDDYVTAAASLTAVLVVEDRAVVMQAGSTAAYLARNGEVVALCGDDHFDGQGMPLLFRALAIAPALDIAISTATLAQGDAIVLIDRRLRTPADHRALLAQLEAANPGEHFLVARIERDDTPKSVAPSLPQGRPASYCGFARLAAALAFLIAVVFAH